MEKTDKPMSIDWEGISFKPKDVIQYVVYAITLAVFFMGQNASVNRLTEKVKDTEVKINEMRAEDKGMSKENTLLFQNMQNQINSNTTDILLLRQEIKLFLARMDNKD